MSFDWFTGIFVVLSLHHEGVLGIGCLVVSLFRQCFCRVQVMPQDTRLVTCDQSSKAIHYKSKFITPRKQAVRNQVDRTDSSQKDQVPRISPIEQFPRSETNCKVQKRKLFQLWRDTVASQKCVSTKEGASGVWRKGIAVVCRSKSKDACVNELKVQSATVSGLHTGWIQASLLQCTHILKTVTVERTLTETE